MPTNQFNKIQLYRMATAGENIIYRYIKSKSINQTKLADKLDMRVKGKYVKTHEAKILDMPEALYKDLKKRGIDKLKSDLYIFGQGGKPGALPVSKNVFYKRHSKIQKACGIGADYSLYSWKHTGNVMLYRKFKDLKMNQAINYHTDISTTDIYLRTKGAYNVEAVRTGFPKI